MTHYRLRKSAVAEVTTDSGAYSTVLKDDDIVVIPGVQATINTSIFNERPTGNIDGVNDTFSLTFLQQGESIQLFRNGLLQELNFDYILNNNTIVFIADSIPQPGDRLHATYSF